MTHLVEDITIKIALDHCEGSSEVLGGPVDLRGLAAEALTFLLDGWITQRLTGITARPHDGIEIRFENTGLYEAPEVEGGDN